MEAVVKPELVWLLEDQAVLDGLKREEDLIRFPDIKDEFLKTDVQGFRHNIFQIDAGIKEEAPISDDRNEDMKTEMDFEEHGILEESTKYFPSHKRSDNTGAQQCGDINIYTNKSDRTVTKRMKSHTGGKLFKCDLCSKCFTLRGHFAEHVRTHTGDKPFKCEVCSKCFAMSSTLTNHIRTHTGDKPFKCEVCSKCFTQRSILIDHVRTHTGDKPFKCELCSKCFPKRCTLTKHIRTHTGEKPFKCELCNRCFAQRFTLTMHISTHTGEKPFKCELCNKCFIQRGNLTSHMRTHVKSAMDVSQSITLLQST